MQCYAGSTATTRLSPYKGLDTFYAAAPSIASRGNDVRIVVAGRPIDGYIPPAPPPGVELIARYLSNAETAQLFQAASVVVCPYHDATQSGVVLTAFAFGVPVVATHVGGLGEYVIDDHTGLIVPPRDPVALAHAVARVLLDGELQARLSSNIRAAERGELDWRNTANALMDLYSECRLQR